MKHDQVIKFLIVAQVVGFILVNILGALK